ncbi:SDR family NAD(P)-dependent oxidoreductase, partial [Streptomonospora sp. S1-112]
AVIGHSQGEIAAAHVAGALTLEDAARIVAARSRLCAPLTPTTGLLVVALPHADAAARLRPWGRRLTVAAVNSPEAVVVAGDRPALAELAAACAAEGVDTREVGSAFASHSPHVEPVRRPLLDAFAGISPRPAEVPFLSTVEGAAVDGTCLGPEYWYANLRRPVLFEAAVRAAADLGRAVFVEISPHPVLRTALARTLEAAGREDAAARVVGTLRRGEGGPAAFTAALADAHVHGAAPSWRAVYSGRPAGTVHLPTYAFQHSRFWAERPADADAAAAAGLDTEPHPLLGAAVTDAATGALLLTGEVAPHRLPWLADHAVEGAALLPGTALADLALHAGDRADCPHVRELALLAPVRLPERGRLQIQVGVAAPDEDGHRPVRIHSRPRAADVGAGEGEWTLHAEGVLAPEAPQEGREGEGPAPAATRPPEGAVPLPLADCYDRLARRGYRYGPAFRGLRAAWRHGADLYAEVALPADRRPEAPGFALHPALLDAALHPLLLAEDTGADGGAGRAPDTAREPAVRVPGEDAGPAGFPATSSAEPASAGTGATPVPAEEDASGAAPGPARPAVRMPFAWEGVRLHAADAVALRVRLSPAGDGAVRVEATDPDGAPVVTVESLTSRPLAESPGGGAAGLSGALLRVDWVPVAVPEPLPARECACVGPDTALDGLDPEIERFPDLAALRAAVDGGRPVPRTVLLAPAAPAVDAEAVRAVLHRTTAVVRDWLADERFADSTLAVLTRAAAPTPGDLEPAPSGALTWPTAMREGAVPTGSEHSETAGGRLDLAGAAVWGLVRAAQSEHPGRFALVDLPADTSDAPPGPVPLPADTSDAPPGPVPLPAALASGEPGVAVRGGRLLAPRMVDAAAGDRLLPPHGAAPWRVEPRGDGTTRLRAVANPAASRPLRHGEVRVSVRAAGLNFRDVMTTLGVFPRRHDFGAECAGVVTETGPGVTDLLPGDRVAGIMHGSFGTHGVADRRLLARVPAAWTDVRAAAAPVAYLTAYHALVDLAAVRPGEKVLVHAAAGGVGLAAVHLARHLGAEVYGTASHAKWPLLRAAGIAEDRIADSRTLDYADRFAAAGGAGLDVVLNAFTGAHVDASLGLLAPGGRFIEIGATDVRRPEDVAAAHPGTAYRAFRIDALAPERLQAALAEVVALLDSGALPHLPAAAWPLHRAHDAFRRLQQGRSTGKLVLRPPAPLHPRGTVLITGGTGRLGALTAHHLVRRHGVRRLVLAGRRGDRAPGAGRLAAELADLGAEVQVRACDAADADALAALLAEIPADRPLTAVVHAAGALADSVVADLTPERLDRVLDAKARAAWNLHTLTRDRGLAAFVLYSSAAAVLGPPGQAGYAAANAYLDALAEHRHALGLPATSIAWGLWAARSELTAGLTAADLARMRRLGVAGPLSTERALEALDTALASGAPHLLALPVDTAGLRAAARRAGTVPPLFRALVRPPRRGAAQGAEPAGPAEAARRAQAARAPGERRAALLDLVRRAAADVLGHPDTAAVGPDHRFLELGIDSLTAVELRNRLAAATGLRLPAGLVFSRTTPAALADHLAEQLANPAAAPGAAPAPFGGRAESRADAGAPSAAPDAAAPPAPAPAPGAAPPASGDDGVVALFRRSCATGRTAEGLDLLRAAARLRPVFETPADLGAPPEPVRLAPPAPGRPRLICFPSLVMISGAHEYARFAAALRGRHETAVLPHPGFAAGEPLPGGVEAVVEAQADAVLRVCGADPGVLVGRSSGGWIAHAVAERLERRGHRPAGLVLLDTPLPGAPVLLPIIETGIMARDAELDLADAARATAMAGYLDLFAAWAPRKVTVPTALVRPAAPVPDRRGAPQDAALWHFTWPLPHDALDVPGDHLTMLEGHAGATAAAVAAWTARAAPGAGS